jgi:GNAT superfamily N-acetyltransferase
LFINGWVLLHRQLMQKIRELVPDHSATILEIINDAANAYKGVIPDDRWKEPYMSPKELADEIKAGVRFYGWFEDGFLLGIAGIQNVSSFDLIRHCYVRTGCQKRGIGGALLQHLLDLARTSLILVGTWEDATWAVQFYQRHGFELVSREEKDRLLKSYWNIPERQIETSVVLKRRGV